MRTWSRKVTLMFAFGPLIVWSGANASTLTATKVRIGDKVPDFALPDVKGKTHSLHEFRRKKAVAVIFIGAKCPSSNAFNQVTAKLAREFGKQRVAFVGIDANKTDSVAEVAEFARARHVEFLLLKDQGNVVADKLGASVTPEVFLIGKGQILRYHGAIGNSKNPTTNPEKATDSDLRPALESLIASKPVAIAETKPFG